MCNGMHMIIHANIFQTPYAHTRSSAQHANLYEASVATAVSKKKRWEKARALDTREVYAQAIAKQ
jgi:hypothetical protein